MCDQSTQTVTTAAVLPFPRVPIGTQSEVLAKLKDEIWPIFTLTAVDTYKELIDLTIDKFPAELKQTITDERKVWGVENKEIPSFGDLYRATMNTNYPN